MTINDYKAEDLDYLIDYAIQKQDTGLQVYVDGLHVYNTKGIEATPDEINLMLRTISEFNPDLLICGSVTANSNEGNLWGKPVSVSIYPNPLPLLL